MDPEYVTLKVNGKDVPIKDFVQDIIGGAIEGMIKTLRMIPESIDRIEMIVEPSKKPS